MSNSTGGGQWRSVSFPPLCSRYSVLVPRLSQLAVLHPSGKRVQVVQWGIGQLASGDAETVGAWSMLEAWPSQSMHCISLKNRGLEHVRYLYVADEGVDSNGLLACYPKATLINAQWLESKCDGPLRSAVLSAVRTAEDIHAGLLRSIRRHGSFENPDAALDFVAATLQRAERRMDRERAIAKVRPRLDSGMQMAGSAL